MTANQGIDLNDKIIIFTDGACRGNQEASNFGGWGAVLLFNKKMKTLMGSEDNTTNNRMELLAILSALDSVKDRTIPVIVFSDSSYVVNCFNDNWYVKWRMTGWKNSKKEPVENLDLWRPLIELTESFSSIKYYRIKGHLDLSKKAEFNKWHKKIDTINKLSTSVEMYEFLSKMNHMADELANRGIDENRM